MGDLNLDLSKNEKFNYIVYGCATFGAAATAFMAPAAISGGIAAHIAIGAVAGGIGLPVAAVVGFSALILLGAGKDIFKTLKKEGPMMPAATVLVGMCAAKAMFISPLQALSSGIKKLFAKKETPKTSTIPVSSAPLTPAKPAALDDQKSKDRFNTESTKPTESVKPKKPKNKPTPPKPSAPKQ